MKTKLKQQIEQCLKPITGIQTLHGMRYFSNAELKTGQINCQCGVGFVISEQCSSPITHYKCVSCGRLSRGS